MAEMLLINPRKRRKARRAGRTAAQRRATAKLVAMNRRRKAGRRRNPVASVAANPVRRAVMRRSNPMRARRRRSNPIGGGRLGLGMIVRQIQDAAIQGAGAVAMDLLYGQVNRFLPDTLKRVPGQIGLGDATKAVLTVALGHFLSPLTRGMSRRAATGALTVQMHGLIAGLLPSGMTLGYAGAGMVTQGNSRVGPNRGLMPGSMGRYVAPGQTPLLNAYAAPGATALLNGNPARAREGVMIR